MRARSRLWISCLACVVMLAAGVVIVWLHVHGGIRRPALVRAGGDANPCRCSQRIEP